MNEQRLIELLQDYQVELRTRGEHRLSAYTDAILADLRERRDSTVTGVDPFGLAGMA